MNIIRDYKPGCTEQIVVKYTLVTNLEKFTKEYGKNDKTIAWACNIDGMHLLIGWN